jgi:hypothetical protein
VGGITNTIGYELEDKAYPALPMLLKRDFGLEVDRLYRRFLIYPDGKDDELNIYGEGQHDGKKVYVVGEAKAQLGRGDVNRFLRKVTRVKAFLGAEMIPLVLTYMAHSGHNIVAPTRPSVHGCAYPLFGKIIDPINLIRQGNRETQYPLSCLLHPPLPKLLFGLRLVASIACKAV